MEDGKKEVMRVFDSNHVPFTICRIFTVLADTDGKRGEHLHRKCNQLMICVSGAIDLLCDDGEQRQTIKLRTDSDGVLVKSGIWAEQTYLEDKSVLLVICDQPYDENDYIRDYDEFLEWSSVLNDELDSTESHNNNKKILSGE